MATASQDVGDETLTGSALCRLDDIADGEGKAFTLPRKPVPLEVFVVRRGARAFGYVNSCPHAWAPLDWSPDHFTNMDKTHILCGIHGAVFDIESGRCISGPCKGDSLTAFPVTVIDGIVHVRAE